MHRLSQIIFLLSIIVFNSFAQSPHGENLKFDCSVCHNSNNWKVNFEESTFDHSSTGFSLVGQHKSTDCISCHNNLVFQTDKKECNSCHTDLHRESVGLDCSKCHDPSSWIVEDINEIHQEGRFPLLGQHLIADCIQCHSGYINLIFDPLEIDCFSCHKNDYNSTSFPNHSEAGFSTECEICHSITADTWAGASIIHDFFPLTGGHRIDDCFACHEPGGNFSGLSTECYSCHQQDYENVTDPNHLEGNFPTDCIQCHTINGWIPATFDHNQTAFPLTGKHIDLNCSECHSTGYSGTPTDCYSCHRDDYESATDPNHVLGEFPTDCSQCHTTNGWEGAEFNHNITGFELTGAHIGLSCSSCHANGYSGTPTDCNSCHNDNYNATTNPNHQAAGIPVTCEDCHSTTAWTPAEFDHNLTGFELTGAHIGLSCSACHANGYSGTSTDCNSCHNDDFNATTNPDHQAAGFPVTCEDCHSTTAWTPAEFDHDGQYFPIYTGKHAGGWNLCTDCHTVPSNYSSFSCIDCHEHRQSEMDDKHSGVQGYIYESGACLSCHPTGDKEGAFNHSNSNFPLTGGHIGLDCESCHISGYENTPTECYACHESHYNSSSNPNHQVLVLSTDCQTCHNTNPGWQPALFPIHDQFYVLEGAHLEIANDCFSCHNGDYNNTTDLCFDCHQSNYNSAPEHVSQNYPTNCEICHTVTVWSEIIFDHTNTNFPLTGEHLNAQCSDCHESGYTGTSTICNDCHQPDYEQSTNPDHVALAIPTDCEDCHTTNANWEPALFPIHNQYYELLGAHLAIANNCDDCHNGNYNNTPNTCYECHLNEFNATVDPPHQVLNFDHDCTECHNQNSWSPANFDHNFYPLSGQHNSFNCNECHNQANYLPQCLDCHLEDFLDRHNPGDPTDCWDCHSTQNWDTNLKYFRMERSR